MPEFSFVLGNPPDPEADARQTLEFIRKVKRVNPSDRDHHVPLHAGAAGGRAVRAGQPQRVPLSGDARGVDQPRLAASSLSAAAGPFPGLQDPLRRELRDFERVLNAYYPTITDLGSTRAARLVLRAASAWRYHLRWYRYPLELRPLQRLLAYQRPETSGF